MLIRSCICVSVCVHHVCLCVFSNQLTGLLCVGQSSMCWLWLRTSFLSITEQLSRGYLAAHMCVLLWNHHQSHLHTHADMWRTCFAVEERGERRLQDAADRVQTSRGRAGNTAGNIWRSDLSEPSESVCWLRQDRRPFPVHTLQPRFLASRRESVCACVCHSLALPSPCWASCPRNVPSSSKMFSGCPPWTIKVILDAYSLARSLSLHPHAHIFLVLLTQLYTHRWHCSVHTRTETCDKPKHYFCISLTSSHKVWSQRASLQFVQRVFCVRGRVCESWLNIASFLFPRSSSFCPQFLFV